MNKELADRYLKCNEHKDDIKCNCASDSKIQRGKWVSNVSWSVVMVCLVDISLVTCHLEDGGDTRYQIPMADRLRSKLATQDCFFIITVRKHPMSCVLELRIDSRVSEAEQLPKLHGYEHLKHLWSELAKSNTFHVNALAFCNNYKSRVDAFYPGRMPLLVVPEPYQVGKKERPNMEQEMVFKRKFCSNDGMRKKIFLILEIYNVCLRHASMENATTVCTLISMVDAAFNDNFFLCERIVRGKERDHLPLSLSTGAGSTKLLLTSATKKSAASSVYTTWPFILSSESAMKGYSISRMSHELAFWEEISYSRMFSKHTVDRRLGHGSKLFTKLKTLSSAPEFATFYCILLFSLNFRQIHPVIQRVAGKYFKPKARRYRNFGEVDRRRGSGRPRVSTREQDEALGRAVLENSSRSARGLKAASGFPGCPRTIHRGTQQVFFEMTGAPYVPLLICHRVIKDAELHLILRTDITTFRVLKIHDNEFDQGGGSLPTAKEDVASSSSGRKLQLSHGQVSCIQQFWACNVNPHSKQPDSGSKVFAASSLWCTYSKLKTILRVREKVDVSSFTNVVSFLKKMSVRHVPRKSNVLSRSQIDEFLLNAPDDVFLLIKILIAFGVFGTYRRQELHDLCFNDVKVEGSVLVVHEMLSVWKLLSIDLINIKGILELRISSNRRCCRGNLFLKFESRLASRNIPPSAFLEIFLLRVPIGN
ncbi:hypothetical protein C0J52_18073 [Blattella germanica]|nr:hypothetical protein C0J52_18073 [Blattella germanica]